MPVGRASQRAALTLDPEAGECAKGVEDLVDYPVRSVDVVLGDGFPSLVDVREGFRMESVTAQVSERLCSLFSRKRGQRSGLRPTISALAA